MALSVLASAAIALTVAATPDVVQKQAEAEWATLLETQKAESLTEDELVSMIARLYAVCLRQTSCQPTGLFDHSARATALQLWRRKATPASASLVLRLEARGEYVGVFQDVLVRSELPAGRCVPPTAQEVAAAKADLADFVVLRPNVERPTPSELNDLAYFMAAIRDSIEPTRPDDEYPAWNKAGRPDPKREALWAHYQQAQLAGDVQETVNAARSFIASFGFPGRIRGHEESEFDMGSSRLAHIMARLAELDELLGNDDEALLLHQRRPIGGGMCGTGLPYEEAKLVQAQLRLKVKHHPCNATVLLALNPRAEVFGEQPNLLENGGYDVTRFYRGAILTAFRDIDPGRLKARLATAPEPLRAAALARFEKRGPEAYASQIDGLARWVNSQGEAAVPQLLHFASAPSDSANRDDLRWFRVRAIDALGRLLERPAVDPCARACKGNRCSWTTTIDLNESVHSLSTCKQQPTLAFRDEVSLALAPLLKDPDLSVRRATVAALGSIGSPKAIGLVEPLITDPSTEGEQCHTANQLDGGILIHGCEPIYPVRTAALTALEQLQAFVDAGTPPPTER